MVPAQREAYKSFSLLVERAAKLVYDTVLVFIISEVSMYQINT